jgi:hypothetical protein
MSAMMHRVQTQHVPLSIALRISTSSARLACLALMAQREQLVMMLQALTQFAMPSNARPTSVLCPMPVWLARKGKSIKPVMMMPLGQTPNARPLPQLQRSGL